MNKAIIIGGLAVVLIIVVIIMLLLLKDNSKNSEAEVKQKVVKEKKAFKLPNLNTSIGEGLIDYDNYDMSIVERAMWALIAGVGLFAVGYVFYRNVIWSLLISFVGLLYPKMKKKDIIAKRKNELTKQFKEALYLICSALSVGKSVEMAFGDALNELRNLYENPSTFIIREFELIVRKINMNETIEDALADFAERAHQEDIKNFADIFIICKRTGGNLNTVIRTASTVIGEKIEIKQDISTQVSGKKYEAKVLTLVPVFIILFLQYSAPDFMAPVYTGVLGRLLMTVALVMIGTGSIWAQKVVNIEV